MLKKLKTFDSYQVLINAQNVDTKLNDWVSSQTTRRGLNREEMCKSIQHLLSLVNALIPKLDEAQQLCKELEDAYATTTTLIATFAKYKSSNDTQLREIAIAIHDKVRIIIRIFKKISYN